MRNADLAGAHLERANLFQAHLEGADLLIAHLEGARLQNASLFGVNLGEAAEGLTQVQINAARSDVETRLPEGLTRPAHWTELKGGGATA